MRSLTEKSALGAVQSMGRQSKYLCRVGAIAGVLGVSVGTSSSMLGATENQPWFTPGRAGKVVSPLSGSAAEIAAGRQVFVQQCVSCHGNKGRGDGIAGQALNVHPGNLTRSFYWVDTDGALFWKISRGRAPMTAFGDLLTEQERWSVIQYVRTLSEQPEHVSAQVSNDESARADISGVLKEYDRLVTSWISGNADFISRQVNKLNGKLSVLTSVDSSQFEPSARESWDGLVGEMTASLSEIEANSQEPAAARESFIRLSAAMVELVETFGHSRKRPVAILEAGGHAWLQLNGPAWSPFGDERDSIRVRHFVDPSQP
jgi:mono/diheme cytochrome c family protein